MLTFVSRFKREEPAVPPVLSWPKKTLEVVVATDKALWMKYDRNVTKLEEYVLATVNAIDAVSSARVVLILLRQRDLMVSGQFVVKSFLIYNYCKSFLIFEDDPLQIYRRYNIRVALMGVENWRGRDEIQVCSLNHDIYNIYQSKS